MKIWLAALILAGASALTLPQSALAQEAEEKGIGGVVSEEAQKLKDADLTGRTGFQQKVLTETQGLVGSKVPDESKAVEAIGGATEASSSSVKHKGTVETYRGNPRPSLPKASAIPRGGVGRRR